MPILSVALLDTFHKVGQSMQRRWTEDSAVRELLRYDLDTQFKIATRLLGEYRKNHETPQDMPRQSKVRIAENLYQNLMDERYVRRRYEGNPNLPVYFSECLHANGKPVRAEIMWQRLLANDHNNPHNWYGYALTALHDNDVVEALRSLERARRLSPKGTPLKIRVQNMMDQLGGPSHRTSL